MAKITDTQRQYHINTLPEEVGRYVILPGDPARVEKIAAHLDDARQISCNREYNVYTGFLANVMVSVCSTGIGGPSSAIAVEELIKCGADTFIRIGTSGGMADKVRGGDLCIANAAIRGEGTSGEYLHPDFPAVADFDVTCALADAANDLSTDELGNRFHVGVVHSKDSFYGQIEPESSPVAEDISYRWKSYLRCGCLVSEMECAAIYAVAAARGVRAGGVLVALWNNERSKADLPDTFIHDTDRGIRCAVNAIKLLISRDK